jgi:hypothetical protein
MLPTRLLKFLVGFLFLGSSLCVWLCSLKFQGYVFELLSKLFFFMANFSKDLFFEIVLPRFVNTLKVLFIEISFPRFVISFSKIQFFQILCRRSLLGFAHEFKVCSFCSTLLLSFLKKMCWGQKSSWWVWILVLI